MQFQSGMLHDAYHEFGRAVQPESDVSALLRDANARLLNFVSKVGILHGFAFSTYSNDRKKYQGSPLQIDLSGDGAKLRFDHDQPAAWVVLQRSLAVVVVLDELFLNGPAGAARFLADTTDAAHVARACFCSAVPQSCLLPDSDFIASEGYETTRELVRRNACAWDERSPTVFWRGATTGQRRHTPPGPDAIEDDFTWLPRLDLCRRARDSAQRERYDLGVAGIARITEPHLLARIEASGFCKPRVGREAFLNRKAIIVIDGNANAWSALFCALLTGACVLKVDSPRGFKQWYYDELVPWRHFVPVSDNLHDLDERVAWVFARDSEEARDIGMAGQAFAEAMTLPNVVTAAAVRLRRWLPTATLAK